MKKGFVSALHPQIRKYRKSSAEKRRNMKIILKKLSISLFVIALAFLIGCGSGAVKQARAEVKTAGEWSYIVEADGNVTIFAYNGNDTNVVTPEEIEGKTVVGIHTFAFMNHNTLTSVTIPDSVTTIAPSAFYRCSSLTNISLPPNLTTIEACTFEGCSSLTSISIPEHVTTIKTRAFAECSSLTNISLPQGITAIESGTFAGCSALTSISIPEHVTTIEYIAFGECSSLKNISIPQSVTTIGDHAFEGCSALTSISIPQSVTSIGRNPFTRCRNLDSITVENGNPKYDSRNNCNAIIDTAKNTLITGCRNTIIPENIASIGELAFCGCNTLTSILIPESVISIEGFAFAGCSNVESIVIPKNVTSIGEGAFNECSRLKKIIIPESVTKIAESTSREEGVFYGCPSGLVIWTTKNSCADKYAKKQGIKVKYRNTSAQAHPSAASMTIKGGLKLTAGKKKLKLTWKKVAKASGYEIQISQKKNFKAAKKHFLKNSKKSFTIKKLKSGAVYYVRIRAYAKADSKKVYGKWVTAKKKAK